MTEERWATIEDFATLFQYLWYRDFPIDDTMATGARRADWTIHIGIVVRNIGDLFGYVTRFEHRSRKDAILRDTIGDQVTVEWEWESKWQEELRKLKGHDVWRKDGNNNGKLKYAVLITYAEIADNVPIAEYEKAKEVWKDAPWPLLFILVQCARSDRFSSHREFRNLVMSVIDRGQIKQLRLSKAMPSKILGTRWSY
jgi:hypothetical protein